MKKIKKGRSPPSLHPCFASAKLSFGHFSPCVNMRKQVKQGDKRMNSIITLEIQNRYVNGFYKGESGFPSYL